MSRNSANPGSNGPSHDDSRILLSRSIYSRRLQDAMSRRSTASLLSEPPATTRIGIGPRSLL